MSKRPFGEGGESSSSKRIRRFEVETSPSSYDQERLIQRYDEPRPLVDLAYKEVRVNWPLAQVPEHIVQDSAARDIQIFYDKFVQEQLDIAEGCGKIMRNPEKYPNDSIIECMRRAFIKLYVPLKKINYRKRFLNHSYLFGEINIDLDQFEPDFLMMEQLFNKNLFNTKYFEIVEHRDLSEREETREVKKLIRTYIDMYILLLKTLPRHMLLNHLSTLFLFLTHDRKLDVNMIN